MTDSMKCKKIFRFAFAAGVFCGLILFSWLVLSVWRELKGGVSARQISASSVCGAPSFLMNEEVSQALSQPYTFWRSGAQSFAFLSEDEKFVLKFPRVSKVRNYLKSFLGLKTRKIAMLKSLCLCASRLEKITATCFIHLNGSFSVPREFKLLDSLHRAIDVNLSSIPFVMQYRKPLFSEELHRVVLDKDFQKACTMLSAFLDLLVNEWERGCTGTDYAFRDNVAYENGKVYRIDIGSYEFHHNSPLILEPSIKPLLKWLKERDPLLCQWFEKEASKREIQSFILRGAKS